MIKKLMTARRFIAAGVLSAFMFVGIASVNAQLTDGLVAHWPLDELDGDTTPDVISGYDMTADNLTADSVVEGKYGNAMSFSNAEQTLLWRKNEEGDALPANQHDSFTVSFWSKVQGNGQNDLRVFSESNTQGDNGPLFNIGTRNNGSDGTIDIYIRGAGPTVGHIFSTAEPFDDEWHHVVFVQNELERSIYVDGELDDLEIAAKPESGWDNIDATTIGGILRGNASHWVTGVIDDVAIWDRALSDSEVSGLTGSGIPTPGGGGNPLLTGLVAHFPLDEDGNSTNGEFTASTVTDVEFGSDGATANTGTSATFNGSSSIIQHDWVAGLNPEDSFTLSVWAKSDGGAGAWHSPVTSRNDLNPDSQGYIIYDNDPSGVWTFWSGNGTEDGNWQTMDGPEASMGEWEHLTIVYDSTEGEEIKRLYVNGELAVESNDIVAENDTKPFNIGAGGDTGTAYFFKGDIDDLALWSRALSASEVADVHANGIPKAGAPVETVPGLIAYWPFDGDLKDGVGDSHGEAMGSEDIAYGSGKFGEGIDLDGVDQFVQTPAENEEMFDFQDGTGFSISAWFSVNEFSKSWQALIAKGEGNRWRIHRRGGESILTGNGGNGDVPGGTGEVTDGELHHIVLVSDPENDEVRLYSDGELASSNNGPAIQSNENPMMIGENPDARNRTWSGIIDDVGIWDRPITEAEIATIWNGGDGTALVTAGGGMVELVPELLAYWPFDGDLVDKVAGLEGEAQGTVEDTDGVLSGAVDLGSDQNWIKVDAEDGWLAPASDEDAMSISLWQKLNVVRNSSTFWVRAESAPSNARNFQAHIPWGNNNIYFDTAGCCGGGDTRIVKLAEIDFLEWHHFVFVKDGENKSIYIDGELFHEGVNTAPLFDDWTYLAIGSSGTGDFAAAIVDEFGVWGRAITADEVASIYNGGAGAPLISAGTATPEAQAGRNGGQCRWI